MEPSSLVAERPRRYGHIKPVYGEPVFLANQSLPQLPDRPARVQVEQKRKLQLL